MVSFLGSAFLGALPSINFDSNFNACFYSNPHIHIYAHGYPYFYIYAHGHPYTYGDLYSNIDAYPYPFGALCIFRRTKAESACKVSAESRFLQ